MILDVRVRLVVLPYQSAALHPDPASLQPLQAVLPLGAGGHGLDLEQHLRRVVMCI